MGIYKPAGSEEQMKGKWVLLYLYAGKTIWNYSVNLPLGFAWVCIEEIYIVWLCTYLDIPKLVDNIFFILILFKQLGNQLGQTLYCGLPRKQNLENNNS